MQSIRVTFYTDHLSEIRFLFLCDVTPCVLVELYLFPVIMMMKAAGSSMASVNHKLPGLTYQ